MKVIFLASSHDDLRWFKKYYVSVFAMGRTKADERYLTMLKVLPRNPLAGHPSETVSGAREFHISRTPFSFLYRVTEENVEIMRVVDNRSNWDQQILQDN
jgi:plasmid stabilization system protein ParE